MSFEVVGQSNLFNSPDDCIGPFIIIIRVIDVHHFMCSWNVCPQALFPSQAPSHELSVWKNIDVTKRCFSGGAGSRFLLKKHMSKLNWIIRKSAWFVCFMSPQNWVYFMMQIAAISQYLVIDIPSTTCTMKIHWSTTVTFNTISEYNVSCNQRSGWGIMLSWRSSWTCLPQVHRKLISTPFDKERAIRFIQFTNMWWGYLWHSYLWICLWVIKVWDCYL